MRQCFFSGSNSGEGFHNYFDAVVPAWEGLTRYFMIKGGPGVGKSTLMKRVAERAEESGEETECFYCSGDPDSLDAVRLVKRGLVLADATAPHCMDPVFPGAVEEIVNLGEQINRTRIVKYRESIEKLTKGNQISYRRAYAFLRAAQALEEERYREVLACADQEKLARQAREISACAEPAEAGRERRLFLDAISCKGRVSFVPQLTRGNKVYRVTGAYKDVFAGLLSASVTADKKEVFCSPLRPACVNHMLLRKPGIFLTMEEGTDGIQICSEELMKRACNKITEVYFAEARRMEEEAMKCLGECKQLHDELEEIYRECVDFTAVSERTEQLLELLQTL